MSDRYLDKVLEGSAVWTDIDDYVDAWHEGASDQSLHDYLGFSWPEYALWVEQPRALRIIIAARVQKQPVEALLEPEREPALAARGLKAEDVRTVREWLRQTGRLPTE
jgi:hypothetical protein